MRVIKKVSLESKAPFLLAIYIAAVILTTFEILLLYFSGGGYYIESALTLEHKSLLFLLHLVINLCITSVILILTRFYNKLGRLVQCLILVIILSIYYISWSLRFAAHQFLNWKGILFIIHNFSQLFWHILQTTPESLIGLVFSILITFIGAFSLTDKLSAYINKRNIDHKIVRFLMIVSGSIACCTIILIILTNPLRNNIFLKVLTDKLSPQATLIFNIYDQQI